MNLTTAQDKPVVDTTPVKKDTTYWRRTLKSGLNCAGSAFSDNWKGGGVNNFNYLLFLAGTANYKKDKDSWDNQMDLQYGQIITKNAPEFRKSQDRIYLDSKYGRALNKNWNMFASFNAQSFFAKGYTYKDRVIALPQDAKIKDTAVHVAGFVTPAYFVQSIGFEYKPTDWYYVRIGAFAAKQTLVTKAFAVSEVEKNYGVDRDKSWRNEFGLLNLSVGINKDLRKNINIKATYQYFFSNIDYFFRRDKIKAKYTDPVVKNGYDKVGAYMDHRLDVVLTAKLTKYITTSFTYIGIYDYDQDKNAQHSHNLRVGILYTLQNFVDPPKK